MEMQPGATMPEEKESYYRLRSKSWIALQRCCFSCQYLALRLTMDLALVCSVI